MHTGQAASPPHEAARVSHTPLNMMFHVMAEICAQIKILHLYLLACLPNMLHDRQSLLLRSVLRL